MALRDRPSLWAVFDLLAMVGSRLRELWHSGIGGGWIVETFGNWVVIDEI